MSKQQGDARNKRKPSSRHEWNNLVRGSSLRTLRKIKWLRSNHSWRAELLCSKSSKPFREIKSVISRNSSSTTRSTARCPSLTSTLKPENGQSNTEVSYEVRLNGQELSSKELNSLSQNTSRLVCSTQCRTLPSQVEESARLITELDSDLKDVRYDHCPLLCLNKSLNLRNHAFLRKAPSHSLDSMRGACHPEMCRSLKNNKQL